MGASGRLGGMLRRHWPADVRLRTQSRTDSGAGIICDPLSEPENLRRAAQGCDAVICLSGVTPVHAAATGDEMSLNTDLALAALAAAPQGARVFAISSAAVYGAAEGPLHEDMALAPLSDYGRAKARMEIALRRAGAGRVTILRIGNVAGADAILGGWRAGMQIDQFADGRTPRRSYIGPVTLARVVSELCVADVVPEVINVAAPGAVEMGALLDAAGYDWTPRPAQAGAIAQVVFDTALLESLCSFAPVESTPTELVAQCRAGGHIA